MPGASHRRHPSILGATFNCLTVNDLDYGKLMQNERHPVFHNRAYYPIG